MGHDIKITDLNALKVYLRILSDSKGKTGKNVSDLSGLVCEEGNLKIPSTTAIFNMGSATDCPSRQMGFCQAVVDGRHVCYAKKAETSYHPFTLPYRRSQEIYWKKTNAEKFATDFIALNMMKRIPFNALRFNESGDFWSQECVDKAEKIARILKRYKVTCYCYSSRKDLDFSHCRDLVVHGSGFKKEGMRGTFLMILNKKDRPSGFGMCPGQCGGCKRCLVGRNTAILRH
jgi:hypothetical protein